MKAKDGKTGVTAGILIRKLRKERGLTQAKLSRAGEKNEICSERHLRRIENGDTEPTPFILNKMLKVLGVSAPEFAQMLDEDENVSEFFHDFSPIMELALDAKYAEAEVLLEKIKSNDKYDKSNPKILQYLIMYEAGVLKNRDKNFQRSAEMLRESLLLTLTAAAPKKSGGYLNCGAIAGRALSWVEYRILLLLANSESELGNFDEALEICDAMMKSLNKKDTSGEIRSRLRPMVYHSMSEAYLKKGLFDKALEASSIGIKEYRYVFLERLLQTKGRALYRLNNIDGAKTAFQESYNVLKLQHRGKLAEIFKKEVAEKYKIVID